MSDKVFSSEEKAKLTQIINEGMTVLQEVEDLNAGLAETVKAISEEMEIKPSVLNGRNNADLAPTITFTLPFIIWSHASLLTFLDKLECQTNGVIPKLFLNLIDHSEDK